MADDLKPENYIVIQGWMINELGLSGNELMVYAIIYGFSQSGDSQRFSGSLQYLINWTNSSRTTVIRSLNTLLEKGYIHKHETVINGVKFCEYNADLVRGVPKWYGGGTKMVPNNIENNIDKENHNPNGLCQKKTAKRFIPPTVEEVADYVSQKGYSFDPEAFVAYYEASGWVRGKTPIKNWKACCVTWEQKLKKAHGKGSSTDSVFAMIERLGLGDE